MDRPIPASPPGLHAPAQFDAWTTQRLDLPSRLRPMNISVDVHTECVRETKGEHGPIFDIRPARIPIRPRRENLMCFASGIRVFNGPREVIIEEVRLDSAERSVYSAPFDAAAFQLETPLPPLRNDDQPYEGEPMRFVAQDLGCFTYDRPLWLMVSPWRAVAHGVPSMGFPPLDALLFVHEVERQ